MQNYNLATISTYAAVNMTNTNGGKSTQTKRH